MTMQFPCSIKAEPFHHLTISTGHLAITSRLDVADDVISMLKPLVQNDGGRVPKVGWNVEIFRPRLRVDGGNAQWCSGGSLPAKDGAAFFTISSDTPAGKDCHLVHCAACWRQELTEETWQVIIEFAKNAGLPIAPNVRRPAGLPWLAVVFNPAMFTAHVSNLAMLGDFERCLAWTLIETDRFGSA